MMAATYGDRILAVAERRGWTVTSEDAFIRLSDGRSTVRHCLDGPLATGLDRPVLAAWFAECGYPDMVAALSGRGPG